MRQNTRYTFYACYLGYISQAIVNNFVPLLFLTFQSTFSLSLDRITLLTTVNFSIQLLVEILVTRTEGITVRAFCCRFSSIPSVGA